MLFRSGVADTLVAGNAAPAAASPAKASPARIGAGNTDGPNTTWSTTAPAGTNVPLDLTAVRAALQHRLAAKFAFDVARQHYADYSGKDAEAACIVAEEEETVARWKLAAAIGRETERVSGASTISPHMRRPADLLRAQQRIDSAFAGTPYEQGHIRDGLRLNQRRRLHTELAELGIAMRAQGNRLRPEQTAEKDEIIADAGNWVAGSRAGSGASPSPGIDEQFKRLKDLLEDVCSDRNFDPDLFAAIVARCRSDIGITGKDDLKRFNDLAAEYSSRLRVK